MSQSDQQTPEPVETVRTKDDIVLTHAEQVRPEEKLLPMLRRYPVIAGALTGLIVRLAFSGEAGTYWSAMTAEFIYGAPILVGMVTVYLAERQKRREWGYYIVAPLLASMLFVLGSLLILIEGLICAVVIVPMFAMLGALGGILMGIICRLTNWPKGRVYSLASVPIVVLALASLLPSTPEIGSIERTIHVSATPAAVWRVINDVQAISADEMSASLASRIGVPMPLSGYTAEQETSRVRRSSWGKQVYFDEVITDWQPDRYLRWTYRFHADSFPRAALDDHVVIGWHYFDLLDTAYRLTPEAGGTRLTTRVSYRISTQFNFYAQWAAQLLIGNLSEVGLQLYKTRSEQASGAKEGLHEPIAQVMDCSNLIARDCEASFSGSGNPEALRGSSR